MSKYTEQAEKFLTHTGTTLTVKFLYTGPYFPGEKELRDVFESTLKNACGEYTSTFGDSILNTKRRESLGRGDMGAKEAKSLGLKVSSSGRVWGISENQTPPPDAHSILARLQKNDVGTFEYFISEFGYIDQPLTEYPRVHSIYHQCALQYAGLRKLFTEEQMALLQEIN